MEVGAYTVSVDVWNTSTSKMSVVITSRRGKVMNTQKPCFGLLIQKFIHVTFYVVVRKRETMYENWVDCVSKTKRNNMSCHKRERADTDLKLCSTLSLDVLIRASSRGLSSRLRVRPPTVDFTPPCLAANWLSLPHLVQPPTYFFSVFYSAPTLNSVPIWVSLQPIRTHCRLAADTSLFVNWASLILHLVSYNDLKKKNFKGISTHIRRYKRQIKPISLHHRIK